MKTNRMKKLLTVFILILALIGCGSDDPATPVVDPGTIDNDTITVPSAADFSILFIGNSLTYTNDLPELVKNRAEQIGLTIETRSLAYSNYAIIDHWEGTHVHTEIASRKYDFVIIQQGPSSQEYGRKILLEYGEKFKAECDHYGAKLAFYMVWPSRDFYHTFDGVIKNYTDAANMTNSILCPVGKVWKEHFDATEDFSYYGWDRFHPSLRGSEVAADVIVRTLFP